MATLRDQIDRAEVREDVITQCCALVEREVAGKRGLSGTAVKAGFGVVKKIKPSMVRDVISALLPDFSDALDPIYQESRTAAGGGPVAELFATRLTDEDERAADALLSVTDRKIDQARPSIQKAYKRLRGTARGHVLDAIPGLATTLAPFTDASGAA